MELPSIAGVLTPCLVLYGATGPLPAFPAQALQDCQPVFWSILEMVVAANAELARRAKATKAVMRRARLIDRECKVDSWLRLDCVLIYPGKTKALGESTCGGAQEQFAEVCPP